MYSSADIWLALWMGSSVGFLLGFLFSLIVAMGDIDD